MDTPEQAMQPYLNPQYWGGRMVGQQNKDELTAGFRYGQSLAADQAVDTYLAHRTGPFPLESFSTGDTLNANDHRPGTIFYVNREKLNARGSFYLPSVRSDEPAPQPPIDLGFTLLGFEDMDKDVIEGLSRRHLIQTYDIQYVALRSFLIVSRAKRGQQSFQPVNEAMLYRREDGHVFNIAAQAPLNPTITLGDTAHYATKEMEMLHRVNAAMLCVEGRAKEKSSIAEKLSHFALNPFSQKS